MLRTNPVLIKVCPLCGGTILGEETRERKFRYRNGIHVYLDANVLDDGELTEAEIEEVASNVTASSYRCENGHTEDQIVAAVHEGLCFKTKLAGFDIILYQTPRNVASFTVRYGSQFSGDLTYRDAALELGTSIMHALTCEGRLDNPRGDEHAKEETPQSGG